MPEASPPTSAPVAVLACGALAAEIRLIARRRGWDVRVFPLPALLHNRPERIAPVLERELAALQASYARVAVAYGDCGSRGAIDRVLQASGVARLAGQDCYDVFAHDEVQAALEQEPGTYLLTDFLARTFEHTVVRQLGLDRWPQLRDDYFGHYTRVLWIAQRPTPATRAAAHRAAARIGLPLQETTVNNSGLERELAALLAATPTRPPLSPGMNSHAQPARADLG